MIFDSTYLGSRTSNLITDFRQIRMELLACVFGDVRMAVLGAEDEVNVDRGQRLWHA